MIDARRGRRVRFRASCRGGGEEKEKRGPATCRKIEGRNRPRFILNESKGGKKGRERSLSRERKREGKTTARALRGSEGPLQAVLTTQTSASDQRDCPGGKGQLVAPRYGRKGGGEGRMLKPPEAREWRERKDRNAIDWSTRKRKADLFGGDAGRRKAVEFYSLQLLGKQSLPRGKGRKELRVLPIGKGWNYVLDVEEKRGLVSLLLEKGGRRYKTRGERGWGTESFSTIGKRSVHFCVN